MRITEHEKSLLQAQYEYNRIPIWIYRETLELEHCFYVQTPPSMKERLAIPMKDLISKITQPDFEIICYENELYYIFSYERNHQKTYVLGGPMLLSNYHRLQDIKSFSFTGNLTIKTADALIETLPVVSLQSFSSWLQICMLLLKHESLSLEEIRNYKLLNMQHTLQRNFIHELFENKEDYRLHTPYREELALLNCIKEGDVAQLESTFKALPETKYGKMSDNPLRQFFYGCIANTTLVTRFAIEGRLDEETAFTLSDVYIQKMENSRTLFELNQLNEKMALDFTKQVAKAKLAQSRFYIEPIAKCMDYINRNLHEKITLDTLANLVNLTPKYLSNLFHKETGKPLSEFIEEKKLAEAKNLLQFTQYSYSQISASLSFHSQSYFIARFKRSVGMTPKEYRKKACLSGKPLDL